MAMAISVGARKRRSTKPSRTPFRRPIRFQPSSRRRAGAPVVSDPFHSQGASRPKAPGSFFKAKEVLRRETGYCTCPLGADVAVAARIPTFPPHRHSVVPARGLVVAERTIKKDFEP